jgi:glucans biosynthesis protein C
MNDHTESSGIVVESVAVAETAAEITVPQTAVPPARRRLLYFDNLRTMLTWLVVVHHAAVAYSDIPMWYYMEPVHDRSAVVLDILLVFDQTFFMGFFFLISGYFVPPSYDRKGGGKFLRERLIRLGIPLVVFILVLGPILNAGHYSIAKAEAAAKGIDLPYWEFYLTSWNPGPLWFIEVLLVFCALYVLSRRIRGEHPSDLPTEAREIGWRPAVLGILGYAFALAVVSYLWRIVVPLGQIWPAIGLPTPAYMSQYATLFVVGAIACRRGWAQALPVSAGWFGLALFLGMIALGPILALVGSVAMVGGGTWQSMAMATWESLAAFGVIVALFVLFRERFNHQGWLARTMSEHAYTVYIIHPLVLVALNHAFRGLNAINVVKFIIVAALAIPLCWISAYVVRSLPYAKRVL